MHARYYYTEWDEKMSLMVVFSWLNLEVELQLRLDILLNFEAKILYTLKILNLHAKIKK